MEAIHVVVALATSSQLSGGRPWERWVLIEVTRLTRVSSKCNVMSRSALALLLAQLIDWVYLTVNVIGVTLFAPGITREVAGPVDQGSDGFRHLSSKSINCVVLYYVCIYTYCYTWTMHMHSYIWTCMPAKQACMHSSIRAHFHTPLSHWTYHRACHGYLFLNAKFAFNQILLAWIVFRKPMWLPLAHPSDINSLRSGLHHADNVRLLFSSRWRITEAGH